MWRRVSCDLAPWRSALSRRPILAAAAASLHSPVSSPSAIHKTPPLFSDAAASVSSVKKRVEDVMPIATGLEREEIQAELEVELGSVAGSGPMGRVVAKDVEAVDAAADQTTNAAAVKPSASSPVDELGSVVLFTIMQRAVGKNMVDSLSVPTFRVGYTITTDALDELYKKIKSKGVTMTALLAKATTMALTKHPVVNSRCRDGKSFTYNSIINIAVAVAIDRGLITSVLQDTDKVDIYSLSRKQKELVDKARVK